jgi:hypothetical protein
MSFVKNKKPKETKVKYELNDRLKALSEEYAGIGYTYLLTERDKQELLIEKLKEKHPDTYYYDINRIIRVQVRGQRDEHFVYRINEEVTDSKFKTHVLQRRIGVHPSPLSVPVRDEMGVIEDEQIKNWSLTWEIPFNSDEIKKLLEGSRTPPTEYTVGKGAITGRSSIFTESPHSVFNLEEWFTKKFDDLYNASSLGYLKEEYGGVDEYIAVRSNRIQHVAEITSNRSESKRA